MAERGSGIPVVMMGLGQIGQVIARAILRKPELRLVAAIDPALAGRSLESVVGGGAPPLEVEAGPERAFDSARGGVVLHATRSGLEAVLPGIEQAVRAGLSVVSTCEELAYPWLRYESLADRLDKLCESNDVAVVGAGVNPGFALDRLPSFLSQVTGPVRHILGVRVADAGRRRANLQKKIGAGLSEKVFHEAADRGELGHVGLAESAALAALGCGLELDEVDEELEPVLAQVDHTDTEIPVERGQVAGIHHVARGFAEGKEIVELNLTLAIGAEDPRDEVELDADPPLRLVIPGGIPGDEATAWALVNAALPITLLRGLVNVLDLPAGR